MSGIAGIIHFDGKPVEPGLIEKMTGAMAHRGPDGISHWVEGSVALGQCMLRTTPESLEEHQPLTNEDGTLVAVMDGRVDNWKELREDLLSRGFHLRTRADVELVLRAYEVWHSDCLSHIDGDFALAIWDARRRRIFCARDRIGNKPFNYHWNGNTFAFSSELHTILELSWVSEVLNEGMLAEFLAAEWHSREETLWQGIHRLVAAHSMKVDRTGLLLKHYWAPEPCLSPPYANDAEYFEHYRELFADVVRRQSRSHRLVAYEVSGGLDSSAVYCVAEHLRRSDRLPAQEIAGYTLAFAGDNRANELAYAHSVGEYLGVNIQEIPPVRHPISWFHQRARLERDFPGFPNVAMFTGIRRHAVSHGARVLLTGEGGDEWLTGSRMYYAEELKARRWSSLYDCVKADVKAFGPRQTLEWIAKYGLFMLLPEVLRDVIVTVLVALRKNAARDAYWLSARMRAVVRRRRDQFHLSRNPKNGTLSQRQLLSALYDAFSAQVMENVERLGSQSGIEIRYPLRDRRFVEFAFSTPSRLRLRGDRTKYIHVKGLREVIPEAILGRKDKAEFSLVFREYLDKMGCQFTELLRGEQGSWIAPAGLAELYKVYNETPEHGMPHWILWSLYATYLHITSHQRLAQ